MNYLALSLFSLLVCSENQSQKLKGSYYADFNNFYQNGYIDFKEDTFTLKHFNLLPYTGTIEYNKHTTYLYGNFDSDIILSIKPEELGKDTIKFKIHNKRATSSYLHIYVNEGKFIKYK